MDKKLKQLFNYQRFAGNADLQKVIDEVNSKVEMVALSDDDLAYVSAGVGNIEGGIIGNDSSPTFK